MAEVVVGWSRVSFYIALLLPHLRERSEKKERKKGEIYIYSLVWSQTLLMSPSVRIYLYVKTKLTQGSSNGTQRVLHPHHSEDLPAVGARPGIERHGARVPAEPVASVADPRHGPPRRGQVRVDRFDRTRRPVRLPERGVPAGGPDGLEAAEAAVEQDREGRGGHGREGPGCPQGLALEGVVDVVGAAR